jgi:hypothetical protein
VRLIHKNPYFSSTPSDEEPKEVLVEMRFQESMLYMPVLPLCIGLTLVPIQRCVRRFVNYRQALRQKGLYWANAVTQMCARQSGATGAGEAAAATGQTLLLLQIASNEDLMCMILHALTQHSFKRLRAPIGLADVSVIGIQRLGTGRCRTPHGVISAKCARPLMLLRF